MKQKTLFLFTGLLFAASATAQVQVEQNDGEVTIGNAYLSRTFSVQNGTLRPGLLVNKRVQNTTFTPSAGSEEFKINPVKMAKAYNLLPKTTWTVEVDGWQQDGANGPANFIIDGNPETYWHSYYAGNGGGTGVQAMPHWFVIDMQTAQDVRSFRFTFRNHAQGAGVNGQVKGYKLYLGVDKADLKLVKTGELQFPGSGTETWVDLDETVTARYVKFEITSSQNGRAFANCAEFDLSSVTAAEAGFEDASGGVKELPRDGWTATASSWCHESGTVGDPSLAIDGNAATLWHTWYSGQAEGTGAGTQEMPHSLTINLGKSTSFRGFGYLPRQSGDNGNIKGYEFAISDDGIEWQTVKSGTMAYADVAQTYWVGLDQAYTATYVRLTETSSQNNAQFGACAEFYLTAEEIQAEVATSFSSSQMTIKDIRPENMDGGKRVIFEMEPYRHVNPADGHAATWKVSMVVEMKDNDHFMRKYLLVGAADDAARVTPIDYIEMENLGTADVAAGNKWTRSMASGGVGGMTAYTLTLGQPVYVDGLFFGSEFPQAENEIDDEGYYHTRYYSGKSLQTLDLNEHRLDGNGYFKTWPNVIGAARSVTDHNIIRTDLFAYINTISRPVKARMQYNSWYDWMLRITETSINSSFMEMERGFSQHGLRPMDSYVVDDGWNNYNVNDPERSGTTDNVSGFWEFNSKFPNGLEGASEIAGKFGSGFGIWLGPRGGYNFPSQWGQFLQNKGNGTYSTTTYDAVTGDSVYISKLREFFLDCQSKYGVNYWKLDGFATKQPQASTNGRYITGGKNGNYYFTEHWERWYRTLADMYEEADGRKADLWLNLTCYVNPSPWILQWSNSVWIQNSNDMGRLNVFSRSRDLDQFLSYRDDRYYDFINQQQLQFPLANIFNHDPLYGKENCVAANAMTDSEFRAYLYMMATRGTAFWEMLYSYNLMNEGNKWMINAEALKFIDSNFETLRNAIYFGTSPKNGDIYGYSCWKGQSDNNSVVEGIVSFRNPSNVQKTYNMKLDNAVGVPEVATGLTTALIMEYSGTKDEKSSDVKDLVSTPDTRAYGYGDTYTVTLKPGEIRLVRFGAKDTTPAAFYSVESTEDKRVTVKFDKPVLAEAAAFQLYEGETPVAAPVSATLGADYRTVTLAFADNLAADAHYTVKATALKDWKGNETTAQSPEFFFTPDSVVVTARNVSDFTDAAAISNVDLHNLSFTVNGKAKLSPAKSVIGRNAFTAAFTVSTTAANAELLAQGKAWNVVLSSGKPVFTVGALAYTAKTSVNDGQPHAISCCRENNGMVKIYIDGQLDGTAYDAAHVCEPLEAARISVGTDGQELVLGNVAVLIGARNYQATAGAGADALAQHHLVTVTAPQESLKVTLSPTTTEAYSIDGGVIARVKSGKTIVVKAVPLQDYYTITDYICDGVSKGSRRPGMGVSERFTAVADDHTLDFKVDMTSAIADMTQGVNVVAKTDAVIVSGLQGAATASLFTVDGRCLARVSGNGGSINIDCSAYEHGTYLLELRSGTEKRMFKLLKP